ncbi:sulfurtransferase TusA family protein [Gymnodinialimonas sp.]
MQEIDARDLLCPLPVLRLRKALTRARAGDTLRLLATDPAAQIDVPHFCAEQGHNFLGAQQIDKATTAYTVRKAR